MKSRKGVQQLILVEQSGTVGMNSVVWASIVVKFAVVFVKVRKSYAEFLRQIKFPLKLSVAGCFVSNFCCLFQSGRLECCHNSRWLKQDGRCKLEIGGFFDNYSAASWTIFDTEPGLITISLFTNTTIIFCFSTNRSYLQLSSLDFYLGKQKLCAGQVPSHPRLALSLVKQRFPSPK